MVDLSDFQLKILFCLEESRVPLSVRLIESKLNTKADIISDIDVLKRFGYVVGEKNYLITDDGRITARDFLEYDNTIVHCD